MTDRPHARRRVIRIPIWVVQLGLLVASAGVVLAAGWLLLAAFLSFGTYLEAVTR